MAKIVLGQRPEKFSRKVSFPMLDDTTGVIACDFRYRTKAEYAQMVDDLSAGAKLEVNAEGKLPEYSDIVKMAIEKNGSFLMDILLGWDLDAELNVENTKELSNAYPAAGAAIADAYRLGCIEGKLGN